MTPAALELLRAFVVAASRLPDAAVVLEQVDATRPPGAVARIAVQVMTDAAFGAPWLARDPETGAEAGPAQQRRVATIRLSAFGPGAVGVLVDVAAALDAVDEQPIATLVEAGVSVREVGPVRNSTATLRTAPEPRAALEVVCDYLWISPRTVIPVTLVETIELEATDAAGFTTATPEPEP